MRAQRSVYPADVKGSAQSCGRWSPSCRWVKCRWSRLLLVRELVWITVLEQGYELAAAVEAATVERLKRAEVAHFDEKGSGAAVLAAHREQQPVYPSVCASQARGRGLVQRCVGAQGLAIHDCLPAYYRFEDMGRAWRTSCANCKAWWSKGRHGQG